MNHGTSACNHARCLAVILARAGSRGLPRKNELPLAGKPLIQWTIEHALGSRRLDHVVCSTDGEALADMARQAGVEVHLRSPTLASDVATVDAAARAAVEQIEQARGTVFDIITILYGNVPLRPADLTDRAIELMQRTGCDSVQSICPVGKMHPYWMRQIDDESRLSKYQPNEVYRRQDLPPTYVLDGGALVVRRACLSRVEPGRPHAFLGDDQRAVVTAPGEVVDVDTALDLHLAEAIVASRAASTALRSAG